MGALGVERFVECSQDNPSVVSAVSAMIRAIGAASGHGARGRASHNPQVLLDGVDLTVTIG